MADEPKTMMTVQANGDGSYTLWRDGAVYSMAPDMWYACRIVHGIVADSDVAYALVRRAFYNVGEQVSLEPGASLADELESNG